MPKKPLITDREKAYIAMAFNQNRDEKTEAIRQIASKRCGRELGRSTVERELAKLRKDKSRGSTDPIDHQWNLASLNDYPVPERYIPLLIQIQKNFYKNMSDEVIKNVKRKGLDGPFMSIRLAIWITRLLPIAEADPPTREEMQAPVPESAPDKWPEWIDDLVNISMFYSSYELACQIAHINPINTAMFDDTNFDAIKWNIIKYYAGLPMNMELPDITDKDQLEKLKKEFPRLTEKRAIDEIEAGGIVSILKMGGKRNARSYNKKR